VGLLCLTGWSVSLSDALPSMGGLFFLVDRVDLMSLTGRSVSLSDVLGSMGGFSSVEGGFWDGGGMMSSLTSVSLSDALSMMRDMIFLLRGRGQEIGFFLEEEKCVGG